MKKIMFNDKYGLTGAVLNGTKTQTRRLITAPKTREGKTVAGFNVCTSGDGKRRWCELYDEDESSFVFDDNTLAPSYKIGEVVAVAQNYKDAGIDPYYKIYNERTKEYDNACDTAGWDNKMFVKAELMPHQIQITNVRVQRLQDISDEDCLKEGIEKEERTDGKYFYKFFDARRELFVRLRTPREAFAVLIDKVNGMSTWWRNPYVFVYDFELVK